MKNAFLIVFILVCLLALCACGGPRPEEPVDMKPVLYLYPTDPTPVSVSLDYQGELTCTYHAYDEGWQVKVALAQWTALLMTFWTLGS